MSSSSYSLLLKLKESGIPANQAEAIYSVIQSNLDYKDLTTKTDVNYAIRDSERRSAMEICKLETKFIVLIFIVVYVTLLIAALMKR